jgi:hypothetical protein
MEVETDMSMHIKAVLYYGFPFFHRDMEIENDVYDHLLKLVDEDREPAVIEDGICCIDRCGDMGEGDEWHYVRIASTYCFANEEGTLISPGNMLLSYDGWITSLSMFCKRNMIPWRDPGWMLTWERS